jgi:hypothetical protein
MHSTEATSPTVLELDRKKNGIFYTPLEAANILCKWAIRSPEDYVLEPGFGGCGFLKSSRQRLSQLNCDNPEDQLFGCDIDPKAFEYLSHTLNTNQLSKRFILQDFLKLQPDDFEIRSFTAAIGNPPYVSHHSMSDDQRETIRVAMDTTGIRLQNKPSLWAYFVLHSLRFLKEGGRCAWLLPGSFVFADYAKEIRQLLKQYFSRSLILVLGERIFLSQGPNKNEGTLEMGFASDLPSMSSIVDNWQRGSWQGVEFEGRPNLALMAGESLLSYTELASNESSKLLGDLCKIRIGIVTGANKFFVINEETALSENIPDEYLSFVLAKFSDARGLRLLKSDLKSLKRSGRRCLLIDTSLVDGIEGNLKKYLDKYPKEEIEVNRTFEKRKTWHCPNDGLIPDAFLSYMHANGPSLTLNVAQTTSTNTIHRVFFNKSVNSISKKAIAISILSTFSQLSAEIEGRSYGSGVLKHEPSEAYRIALLLPSITDEAVDRTFSKIDSLLRQGMSDKAQVEADNFVLSNYSDPVKQHHLSALGCALKEARSRRQRPSE